MAPGMITTLILFATPAFAEKSAFEQAIESQADYSTREQWVEQDGVKFREVEHRGQKYYVKFLNQDGSNANLSCELPASANARHLVEAGAQVYKRSKVFIEFLQDSCVEHKGRTVHAISFDALKLGFTIPDGKKPILTNKKITIDPLHPLGAGFQGNF